MIPVVEKIREAELENHMHSELITRCVEWLPDTLAYVVSSAPRSIGEKTSEQLDHLERGIADRVFRLMESVLQMGITQRCPCYDAGAIAQRVDPILELTQVIKDTSNRERKEKPQ